MNDLVSIIIPTYNRANLIEETLQSVLQQTYIHWECIVVDDGSLDNTAQLMAQYTKADRRITYVERPSNRPAGGNAARNYGFQLSKGKYIQWFDSDDILHPQKLEKQVKLMQENSCQYSVCQTLVFEGTLENILGLRKKEIVSSSALDDYIMLNIVWMTPSALWKREFLEGFDYLFDEQLFAAQEWEFHSRVMSKNDNYLTLDEPLIYIRKHLDSISHQKGKRKKLWNYFLARNKVYTNPAITLNRETQIYLRTFQLDYFKKLVRNQYRKEALAAFKVFIKKEKDISFGGKVASLIAIYSFSFFRKGTVFLNKVNFTQ